MSRILFIGLSYYAYTRRIIESLRKKGHDVTYYPIETGSLAAKTMKRYAWRRYKKNLDKYHRKITDDVSDVGYDEVIFLQPHHFSHENMTRLRHSQPQARFILYNWDSLATHDYAPYLKYFDSTLTFDRNDAARLGIGYLPLFALPEYFNVRKNVAIKYDLYFVGAVATFSRFNAIMALHRFCQRNKIRLKLHLHCNPPMYFLLLRKGLYLKGMSLRSLSPGQIIDVLQESRAVFDFPNHLQSGYTMRLIENLCAGKKIVTSNDYIKQEAFFCKDRILVVTNLDFASIPGFLKRPLISEKSFSEFSLDRWTDELIR
jgi:hypothetical protein